MGTSRTLDGLTPIEHADDKARILREHRDDVLVAADNSLLAPLERAALRVEEDLCVLVDGILVGGCVCFPSHWRLCEKVGHPVDEIHGRVPGYAKGSQADAQRLLTGIFKNVTVEDKSANDSLKNFTSGNGDVAITYEYAALTAQASGDTNQMVIPPSTVAIQTPTVVVDKNAEAHCVENIANAFVKYLHTPDAQAVFASVGYERPIDVSKAQAGDGAKLAAIPDLFTTDQLGGWDKLESDTVFGPNTSFVSHSNDHSSISRAFTSFDQAVAEAGESRVVGGIHFESANLDAQGAAHAVNRGVVDPLTAVVIKVVQRAAAGARPLGELLNGHAPLAQQDPREEA